MAGEITMGLDERYVYLRVQRLRYTKVDRAGRSLLLTEMEQVTGLHRKSLLRLMHGDLQRHVRTEQRGRVYGPEVEDAVLLIARLLDYPCAQRLTPALVPTARHLAEHQELTGLSSLHKHLAEISFRTVQRILQRHAPLLPRRSPSPPGPVNQASRDVPMTRIPWETTEPGHFEADLVHHCGSSTTGQYMHTLQLVDVATGWSERTALLNRSYSRMDAAFQRVQHRLPFGIRELHPDNGGEFFNTYLRRSWVTHLPDTVLSRSRPYHKNDNRFVEQKNQQLVRAYLGDQRLDTAAQTSAAEAWYQTMWLYYNFFQPVLRLETKTTMRQEDGSYVVKRTHDTARTPFDRLCETAALSPQRREELSRLRDGTNLRTLKQTLDDQLEHLLSLPSAQIVPHKAVPGSPTPKQELRHR